MAQTIDPAFQGAPYLGESTHDPLEFARRNNLSRYQQALAQSENAKKDFDKGLKDLTMEIKGWEDQKGFEEISDDLSRVQDKYIELSSKGYNLTSPTTKTERMLSNGIRQSMSQLRQKHDVWQRQKEQVVAAQEVIREQLAKPEEERDIDTEAVASNIKDLFKTDGVLGRNEKMGNLIVNKARPVDVSKYFLDNFSKVVPGMDKQPGNWIMDKTTGKFIKTDWEGIDPKRAKAGVLTLYDNIQTEPKMKSFKKELERQYASDPDKGMMSKEEWVLDRFQVKGPERKSSSLSSEAGNFNIDWDTILPGKNSATGFYDTNQFKESKSFGVPAVGQNGKPTAGDKEVFHSASTIPLQGVFKAVFTMPNAVHSVDAETGLQAPQARSAANMADNVSFLPIAKKDLSVSIPVYGPDGKEIGTKERKFNAGDKIPAEVQRQLVSDKRTKDFVYDAFLTSLTSYKQVPKETPDMFKDTIIEDMFNEVSSKAATTITPWREVQRYVKSAATRSKVDITRLDNFITDYLKELNSMDSVFGENAKEVLYEEIYQ